MNNIVILPIIIPLFTGLLLFFIRKLNRTQRWFAALGTLLTLVSTCVLIRTIHLEGIQVLHVGGWQAPFGIALVADMFAILLAAAASVVTLLCLLYAFSTAKPEEERTFLYAFVLFLLCGVNGSFITGDLFNLFVFFEVMLSASYVLLSFGGTRLQLRESIKYMLINIVSSTLFVVAVAYLYSVTGTLNMAHLADVIATAGQDGLITTISLLFLFVFALKAALFIYYWLPGAYIVAPTAIAAIFAALLTKVGIYAIFRMFSIIFYHQPHITHTLIIWLAALTMVLGAFGAISQWDIRRILVYNVIVAVGFIVFGFGVFTETALLGSVYYLLQDMFAKALIFILGGIIIYIARTHQLRDISGLMHHHSVLGWLFFLSALILAGVPPLSGFVGKLLVIQAGLESEQYIVTGIGLLTSLLVLYSMIKIMIHGFWGDTDLSEDEAKSRRPSKAVLIPGFVLAGICVAMGLFAEPLLQIIEQASHTLAHPSSYIQAVLSPAN